MGFDWAGQPPDQVSWQRYFKDAPAERPAGPHDSVATLADLGGVAVGCQGCGLRVGCRQVVFGEGPGTARLLLVGEGPGATEDEVGRPFVGAAGQLLDRILTAAGLSRAEVYITNVVKCRPPANRLPAPDEVAACRPYLERQIDLIRPAVILCLGSLAAQTVIDRKALVTKVRGQWFSLHGAAVMATFHPAALLRDPGKKPLVWQDIQAVRDRLAGQAAAGL